MILDHTYLICCICTHLGQQREWEWIRIQNKQRRLYMCKCNTESNKKKMKWTSYCLSILWRTRCEKCLLDSDASFIWLLHTTSRPVHIENMHLYKKDRQWIALTRSGHKVSRGELIDSVTDMNVISSYSNLNLKSSYSYVSCWSHNIDDSENVLSELN